MPQTLTSNVLVFSPARSSAPAYSMTGRSKIGSFHEDLRNVSEPLLFICKFEQKILYLQYTISIK